MKKIIVFGVDGLMMPLLKKFAAEGVLPNIDKMFNEGSAAELLPFISAWGDVNWVTFMAGQCPGTSWIGQSIPADNSKTANLLAAMQNRNLKAALVHFPETVSADAPHFELAPYWGRSAAWPLEVAKPVVHTTRYSERVGQKAEKKQKLGWPPVASLAYHEKGSWCPITTTDDAYSLTMRGMRGGEAVLSLDITATSSPVLKFGSSAVSLPLSAWSDWLPVKIGSESGLVRFFLGRFDPKNDDIEILQSQMTYTEKLASEPVLGKALTDKFGPFISKWTVNASANAPYLASTYTEGDYQSLWLANTAVELTHKHGFSVWATVHRLIDESHHNCLGQCDPASPFYNKERAPVFEDIMRDCYKLLDKSMGHIMDAMDDECVLMLASDHGNVPNEYMCDVNRFLAKFGLVTLDDKGGAIREKSKVYLKDERGGLEIYVNLIDREKHGIVAAEDYRHVCEEVLHALRSWSVTENGKLRNAVGYALLKEDAVGIGYWGEHAGDVIFAYNTGFVWGVSSSGEDICPVLSPGANHGPQKPTAETAYSSNYGVLIAYGSGIKKGYYRDRTTKGPYRMVDPAATIAHILELGMSSLDGQVMHDFLV